MRPARVPPTARVLAQYLGDGGPLTGGLGVVEAWLVESAPFRAFVDAHRDKIRKKVRLATSDDARLDLRAELAVASRLLSDRRFDLAFEAYGSRIRGPDFTATFRDGRPFNVEVTRRRATGHASGDGLARPILGKLRQLPTGSANVLVIAVDATELLPDPGATLRELRRRAERRDDGWFATHGIADAVTFNQGVLRLSAVLAWTEGAAEASRLATWVNGAARIAVDAPALRAIETALRA